MKPEHEQVLARAEEGLRAAKVLLDRGFAGFASSRAYYSMFAAAEALLSAKGMTFSKHAAVIAAFGQHFAKTGLVAVELHRALLSAQERRLAADYGGVQPVSPMEASEDIRNAQQLLDQARKILSA